jgi:hypothetical protein
LELDDVRGSIRREDGGGSQKAAEGQVLEKHDDGPARTNVRVREKKSMRETKESR